MSEKPQYVITVHTGFVWVNNRTQRYETLHEGVMSLEDWRAAPMIHGIAPSGTPYSVPDPTYRRSA